MQDMQFDHGDSVISVENLIPQCRCSDVRKSYEFFVRYDTRSLIALEKRY